MVRTRKYNRVIRYAKQKWAPVIKSGTITLNASNHASILNIVTNSADTSTPTPVVLKVKHMRMQVDASVSSQGGVVQATTAGVVFIPEGITVNDATQLESLIASHPEWVMLFDLVDTAYGNTNTLRSSSPLSRNLNSGDRLCLFAWSNADSGNFTVVLSYILKWVVRAN